MIIHSNDWREINNKITNLKIEFFKDVYVDLKGLRRYKYECSNSKKKTINPFHNISPEERELFCEKLFDILDERKMIFLASIIDKESLKLERTQHDPYLLSFRFLIERFNMFCNDSNDFGMVQIEMSDKDLEKNLRRAQDEYMRNGTNYAKIDRIIESCQFVFGPKNNYAQISDLFINSVFRCAEHNNSINLEKYMPFIRGKNGRILGYGLKVYPPITNPINALCKRYWEQNINQSIIDA